MLKMLDNVWNCLPLGNLTSDGTWWYGYHAVFILWEIKVRTSKFIFCVLQVGSAFMLRFFLSLLTVLSLLEARLPRCLLFARCMQHGSFCCGKTMQLYDVVWVLDFNCTCLFKMKEVTVDGSVYFYAPPSGAVLDLVKFWFFHQNVDASSALILSPILAAYFNALLMVSWSCAFGCHSHWSSCIPRCRFIWLACRHFCKY